MGTEICVKGSALASKGQRFVLIGKDDAERTRPAVEVGSQRQNLGAVFSDVRFTPQSGHQLSEFGCPLSAQSGLVRCSKIALFDHLVGTAKGQCQISLKIYYLVA